jgi:hypothetical protein
MVSLGVLLLSTAVVGNYRVHKSQADIRYGAENSVPVRDKGGFHGTVDERLACSDDALRENLNTLFFDMTVEDKVVYL